MGTVRDLLKGSMKLIGVISAGETPTADEQADAFSTLKTMMASWSTERLIIGSVTPEEFDLVGGQQSYTIGSAGNFNTTRPLRIQSANIKDVGSGVEIPMQILSENEWANIHLKSTTSTLPTKLYYEATYPLGKIYPWPVPTVANKLVLNSVKPLSEFADVNATVDLAPGVERALRYNLAVELAPEYNKEVSATVVAIAIDSKSNIKRMNIKPEYLSMDAALVGRSGFNIITGE